MTKTRVDGKCKQCEAYSNGVNMAWYGLCQACATKEEEEASYMPHVIDDIEGFMQKSTSAIRRFFRWPWQKVTRGFCDKDLWGLDYTIAKFIRPRIKVFRQNTYSHPGGLTEQQWDEILKSIEEAMDLICREEDEIRNLTPFEYGQIEIGLNNLAYYFRDLWD